MKEQVLEIAKKFESRAAWSTRDPASYDWAIMNLEDAEFAAATQHMHDQKGKVLVGDAGEVFELRKQLQQARQELDRVTGDERFAAEVRIMNLELRVHALQQ